MHTPQLSLRVYPGAQQVANAYGYFGASAGQKALYYWTPEPIEVVQTYYEEYSSPFITDRWNGFPVTVFSIDGSRRNVDYAQEPRCHYTQKYKCVNIWLVSIPSGGLRNLPDVIGVPASSADNTTPYLSATLQSGTLIMYGYYVNDFSCVYLSGEELLKADR